MKPWITFAFEFGAHRSFFPSTTILMIVAPKERDHLVFITFFLSKRQIFSRPAAANHYKVKVAFVIF